MIFAAKLRKYFLVYLVELNIRSLFFKLGFINHRYSNP